MTVRGEEGITIEKSREDQYSIRDKLLTLLRSDDSTSVLTVLDAIEKNDAIAQNCHEIAHDIGHRAYTLYGFSGAMALGDTTTDNYALIGDICAGGYMHGILENLLVDQPERRNTIGNLCLKVPLINRASCFHGIGHGLMFINERNVPHALADCRALHQPRYEHHCFEGIWMEMFWGDTGHTDGDTLGWSLGQPLLPCIETDDDAKPACFLYANLGYLRSHSKDFAGAISVCTNAHLSKRDTEYCLKGTGMTIMQFFMSNRLKEPDTYVRNLTENEKYAYYQGLIAYARLSGFRDEKIAGFCAQLHDDKDECTSILKNIPR